MNTGAPRPPPFPLGARVEYTGDHEQGDIVDGKERRLRPGDVGVVVEVRAGRRGTGRQVDELDGEPLYDETSDGWSVVRFPSGYERAPSASTLARWPHYRLAKAPRRRIRSRG